jgi:hypothetical protein
MCQLEKLLDLYLKRLKTVLFRNDLMYLYGRNALRPHEFLTTFGKLNSKPFLVYVEERKIPEAESIKHDL